MAEERSKWRVTVEEPTLAATYVEDSKAPTVMQAVGDVLHNFSMRTNRNLNSITRVECVAVHR